MGTFVSPIWQSPRQETCVAGFGSWVESASPTVDCGRIEPLVTRGAACRPLQSKGKSHCIPAVPQPGGTV